jgi:hypothetical protein
MGFRGVRGGYPKIEALSKVSATTRRHQLDTG